MTLAPMRFKDYVWPHNPRVYSIEYERKMAVHKVPKGLYHLQDMGLTRRVMRGTGEFVGEGAYAEFGRLANVFYHGGAGMLIHPVWVPAQAYFVQLKVEQQPRADYVRYSFVFWETAQPVKAEVVQQESNMTKTARVASKKMHKVQKGETLFAIAVKYGKTLQEILEMNPQIKNPNLIYPGDEVQIQ